MEAKTLKKTKKDKPSSMPMWIQKSMGKKFYRFGLDSEEQPCMLAPMLSGTPETQPQAYALFSPIEHVHKECPLTLLISGEHDIIVFAKAVRQLGERLTENGVPALLHILPQTDYAFDLILPKISPSAHNAYYYIEGFLALLENKQNDIIEEKFSNREMSTR